jgi:amphi-Trp domain-containing protein
MAPAMRPSKGEIGMAKNKVRAELTREEAADQLAQLAQQLRAGTISLGGDPMTVPNDVKLKANLDDDELEMELKWET